MSLAATMTCPARYTTFVRISGALSHRTTRCLATACIRSRHPLQLLGVSSEKWFGSRLLAVHNLLSFYVF